MSIKQLKNKCKYEVVFAADKIKYLRRDGNISTKTEIVVCKNHHAEIRKITFKNESDTDKELEIVGIAKDGEAAYHVIKEKEPDVVLLDVIMPKLDGLGVMEHVKKDITLKKMVKPL